MNELEIVVPEGSFGPVDEETVAGLLRTLTRDLSEAGNERSMGLLGGEYGYGVEFSNDVFLMHPFCWCEQDDCPWCVYCDCDAETLVDGVKVTDYEAFYNAGGYGQKGKVIETRKLESCEFEATGGPAAAFGGGPGQSAPNFWHKASGFKVWWYKYIGRGMEMENPSGFDSVAAIQEARASIAPQKAGDQA